MRRRLFGLLPLWLILIGAAAPLPLTPPPPDLARVIPFASAPLDKPPVGPLELAPPPVPLELPALPPASLVMPSAERPVAPLTPPGALPCVGAWFGIAAKALECGRARFDKGEYDDAIRALEPATRASDADLKLEARYWLAEALDRVGRSDRADSTFRQVARDGARQEYGIWALHASGWTALRLADPGRARDTFAKLRASRLPVPIVGWVRHGLGLALYAVGKYEDAEKAWADLTALGIPSPLARDVLFWHGETLGRIGQYARAEALLGQFGQGGPHPSLEAGLLQRGWWSLAAGHPGESVQSLRAFLAATARSGANAERDWGEAGLAFALSKSGDWDGARGSARALLTRRSPLAIPVLLALSRAAVEAHGPADARGIIDELLATNLAPPVRAWALFMNGEAYRGEGSRDDARTQYDVAQKADPAGGTSRHAAFRLAELSVEARDFSEAVAALGGLLKLPLPAPLRAAALLMQGEAAYHAGDYAAAGAAFRRALVEFPDHPGAADARFGIAWTALRQHQTDEARRQFMELVRTFPDHPHLVDALLLASELAADVGDINDARQLLDRVISTASTHPRAEFARLNRAIIRLRSGEEAAQRELSDWVTRAPFPPLLGRAHAALGVALLDAGQPDRAVREFESARRDGAGGVASLGMGVVALVRERWDDATRALTEARESGPRDVSGAAEYGLAVVAFHRGAIREFKPAALAALQAGPSGLTASRLLYVLTGIAVEEKDWVGALTMAKRLVAEFPSAETADDALERVGAAAARDRAWPVVGEAYTLLRTRYPESPFVEGSWLPLAQAKIEIGHADEVRQELEQFVAASPTDPRTPQAWVVLARAREATGDRRGALDAYARAESQGATFSPDALVSHARVLVAEKRSAPARAILERLLKSDDPGLVAAAAQVLGDAYRGDGEPLVAAEYYMTVAYLLPESPVGRRALLAAAQSLEAGKQRNAAANAYRKLLAQGNVEADLAETARQRLDALGRQGRPR